MIIRSSYGRRISAGKASRGERWATGCNKCNFVDLWSITSRVLHPTHFLYYQDQQRLRALCTCAWRSSPGWRHLPCSHILCHQRWVSRDCYGFPSLERFFPFSAFSSTMSHQSVLALASSLMVERKRSKSASLTQRNPFRPILQGIGLPSRCTWTAPQRAGGEQRHSIDNKNSRGGEAHDMIKRHIV